ncbi:methionyl-tRNA formyltransferase [Sporormia fimetaria CBS 119925]|uniref:methionyl-tRNA formyltransferase n=1 Tax=Sporormia fimetaria CBS 119925 TaxID=1340428 RepID=A0A6A6UYK5_9PLEO|nr:methionyl-tRNA formyltransferase [Sporormia fimetaria CBS 119925]
MLSATSISLRSLLRAGLSRRCFSHASVAPLSILFCGSDEFSIASLRALHQAQQLDRNLIRSIEVVHRPAKRTGRGLKVVREVPIKRIATRELALVTHEVDTFTGWTPPSAFDIVIAVSFGRLVPPRILNAAQYGGLNVHPSLLPDLRGPAPIHHTLLKKRARTGVTVQTLHPEHFDHGTILGQTPPPGIDVPEGATTDQLVKQLGALGGEMLVSVLKAGAFVPPVKDAGWYGASGGPVEHAEKISSSHRAVDFGTATADDILTRHRVLGDLWCLLPRTGERVILNEIRAGKEDAAGDGPVGIFVAEDGRDDLLARTADGQLLSIVSSTIAGGKRGTGNDHIVHVVRR